MVLPRWISPRRTRTLPENATPPPIACVLEGDALRTRWERWRALLARSGANVVDLPDGIELTFTPDAAAELHFLVAAERACCAWADWSIAESDDALVLRATAPVPEGVGALRAFFA